MSKRTSAGQFVTAYMQRGGDMEAISSDLGIGKASVYQRTRSLRKAGVRLPKQGRHANRLNVRALNELIREYKKRG